MKHKKTLLVIFGITGDLAKRKLLPALRHLSSENLLKDTTILGISRQKITKDSVLNENNDPLIDIFDLFTMDVAEPKDYVRLKSRIKDHGHDAQVLFYLSVPPFAVSHIVTSLGQAGLNDKNTVKLLLEKPFGTDLASAQEAIDEMLAYFDESQLYRIDHYLAKEMSQNIIAFRGQNALFRHLWGRQAIERIEILATETIGIEGRVQFYEQTGALRDFMQNHMMQLLALTLMELPEDGPQDIPARRLRALQSIVHVRDDHFYEYVSRGQYSGYKKEVGNLETTVETFVALTLYSNDPNWAGVQLRLITGKALSKQTTEIRVYFKKSSHAQTNSLVLHIQPKEAIEIDLWAKQPGLTKELQKVGLQFDYAQTAGQPAEAYERVLIDAISSDKSLFTTAGEVIAAWELLQPIQERWANSEDDLKIYEGGSSVEEVLEG